MPLLIGAPVRGQPWQPGNWLERTCEMDRAGLSCTNQGHELKVPGL